MVGEGSHGCVCVCVRSRQTKGELTSNEGRQARGSVCACVYYLGDRTEETETKKGSSDGGKKDVYVCNLYIRVDFF